MKFSKAPSRPPLAARIWLLPPLCGKSSRSLAKTLECHFHPPQNCFVESKRLALACPIDLLSALVSTTQEGPSMATILPRGGGNDTILQRFRRNYPLPDLSTLGLSRQLDLTVRPKIMLSKGSCDELLNNLSRSSTASFLSRRVPPPPLDEPLTLSWASPRCVLAMFAIPLESSAAASAVVDIVVSLSTRVVRFDILHNSGNRLKLATHTQLTVTSHQSWTQWLITNRPISPGPDTFFFWRSRFGAPASGTGNRYI